MTKRRKPRPLNPLRAQLGSRDAALLNGARGPAMAAVARARDERWQERGASRSELRLGQAAIAWLAGGWCRWTENA